MLDLPRYLVGVADIALLATFATLGAHALRTRLLPTFDGAHALLATLVLSLAILQLTAQLLGTVSLLQPLPYALAVALVGTGTWLLSKGGWGGPVARNPVQAVDGGSGGSPRAAASCFSPRKRSRSAADSPGEKPSKRGGPPDPPPFRPSFVPTLIALTIAAIALAKFGIDARAKLGTGMTGFDSTWYHGPLAAEMLQTANTWDLHFIAPQFLAWFYPANSELFHAIGMLAFDRDLLSPLLNLGWLGGCLLACWCIGRPYRVAPWSLALGAVALSLPAFADQAGEARNDIVATFFLLAAVGVALNAAALGQGNPAVAPRVRTHGRIPTERSNALALAALAAGLAAGTKLNFVLPAAVLVAGLALIAPRGARWPAFGVATLAALLGGGYWYLRNLAHSGNPLPWIDGVGPISLPSPDQPLGGREGHSVLGYLTDGAVWSDWFLPGLAEGLWTIWPLVLAAALAGLLGAAIAPLVGSHRGSASSPALALAGLAGLATALAWLIAPTSASGPEGMPRGFESGLRYLVPALALGLALIPTVLPMRFRRAAVGYPPNGRILKTPISLDRRLSGRGVSHGGPVALILLAAASIAIGYPVQRHYLENRYANPTFAAPGLNAAFEWSRSITDSRIATTATRIYPVYGTDLSNEVRFVGEERSRGGFVAPSSCRAWLRLLDAGNYDYVVATRDRLEPDKAPYPPAARWTEGSGAKPILRQPPTVIFQLTAPLDPSACPSPLPGHR